MDTHLTFHSDIFSKIDSEEKAYWLGFLYADGYIAKGKGNYRIELGLAKQDYNHLVKFRKFIGKNNTISYRNKTSSYRYSFRDKQIHQDLVNLGCTNAKSLILTFPTEVQVPKELQSDFIRGYFDGDGSLWFSKDINCSILGTKDFLKGLQNCYADIQFNSIVPIHYDRPDKGQRIMICGNKKSMKFLDYIYQNATVYLDRKYHKYLYFKNATSN